MFSPEELSLGAGAASTSSSSFSPVRLGPKLLRALPAPLPNATPTPPPRNHARHREPAFMSLKDASVPRTVFEDDAG